MGFKIAKLLFLICIISSAKCLSQNPKIIKGGRIIGGELAKAGQFTWMAAIYKTTADGRYFCAGTIITDQWILTAAQCVIEAIEFVIHFGSHLLDGDDSNRLTVAAEQWIIHDNWNASTLWTDIGLIKLRMPIEFTDYIQPVQYYDNGYLYPGRPVVASGWGQISDSAGSLENELRYTEVAIIDQHECESYYGKPNVFPSMICAQGNYNEGICYGDIGGALVTQAFDWVGNHSVAVAIGSWMSQNGCESLDPNGYTRIDSYYSWINQIIAAN